MAILERIYIRPATYDRIRARWLGPAIEQYVVWLTQRQTSRSTILRAVQTLEQFDNFVRARGAQSWQDLPQHVAPFINHHMQQRNLPCLTKRNRGTILSQSRTPVEQMLRLIVPGFVGTTRLITTRPFEAVPGFWSFLEEERGLSPDTLRGYIHCLRSFDRYLQQAGVTDLSTLSPAVIRQFVEEQTRTRSSSLRLQKATGIIRVFLRYLRRQRITATDLSPTLERLQHYRQAKIPRSISWEQVRSILAAIDRRAPIGKRDYAILLLLLTYGFRANEVAHLMLDDIDWKRDRVCLRQRKGGQATTMYPLSPQVGAALVDYLQNARPKTDHRNLFINTCSPYGPMRMHGVSHRAGVYLRRTGVTTPRPGSHTFRHTCVQRLVDADFSFKTIGDYVGHRREESTHIYGKIAVETLRNVALGDGEDVL